MARFGRRACSQLCPGVIGALPSKLTPHTLYEARLYEARLYEARLYEAQLYEARLYKARLYEACYSFKVVWLNVVRVSKVLKRAVDPSVVKDIKLDLEDVKIAGSMVGIHIMHTTIGQHDYEAFPPFLPRLRRSMR
jgi:hypothetical protein